MSCFYTLCGLQTLEMFQILTVHFPFTVDNNTVVMKFDPQSLEIQYMWNISLNHHNVADTFIVCGVLYAVDHVERSSTRIRFALDLYRNKLLDVELPFSNPFSYTTALGYNPRLKVIQLFAAVRLLTSMAFKVVTNPK